MWYLTSLLLLLFLVGVGVLTGSLLTACLPARTRPAARIFLSLPLGWALLTLVATLFGWLGHGFAACPCAAVTAALAAAGAWTGRRWLRHAGGDCLRLAAFCVLASFPVLYPLLLNGDFNLYNDTFLYHGQALWLQHHGFLTPARTDGGHPLWGVVIQMQTIPLRMGACFLLAWVQAMFGLELPHKIFPVVAALGTICGALGVGSTLLAACPGRWLEAWLSALAAAATLNGFAFGAAAGFLPQTWGLAFASAAFGLRGLELGTHAGGNAPPRWHTGVPLGVCVAASMHCYWDLLPLEAPALLCTYLLPWPGRDLRAWRALWAPLRSPLLTCLLLVNLEWGRAVRGILFNLHVVVANPVAWSVWDFLGHALGFRSSVWERPRWITQGLPLALLPWGCAAATAWLALLIGSQPRRRRSLWLRPAPHPARWRWQPLVPALVWLALSFLLFAYFRLLVPSPWRANPLEGWPDGVGQSWSQYKLTLWGSLASITVLATLGTALAMRARSPLLRTALIFLLTAWCGTGLSWNIRISRWRGEDLLVDTGTRRDPLAPCLAMRQRMSTLPPGDWIYLDWPPRGRGNHFRDLMVSLLFDHPLASDWSTDPALSTDITPGDARRTPADCQWVLRYRPPADDAPAPASAIGGMTLERTRPQPVP